MDINEDILRDALWNELQINFDFQDEGYVIPYFLFRERMSQLKPSRKSLFPIEYPALGHFILEECGIKIFEGNTIQAEGIHFPSTAFIGTAFRNILEDWWFQAELLKAYSDNEWDAKFKDIMTLSKKATPVKASHPMYHTFIRSYAFGFLNEAFRVSVTGEYGDNFVLTENALLTPTREEEYMRYIQAYYQLLHKSEEVSEEQLERYLMRHLDVVEEGLRMVDNQVQLPEGRIDILARDTEERDVIIEIKVAKDTDLIWQRMYYESEWKKKNNPPRMIIVTTKPLDASVREMLERVGETLVLEVTPYVQNKKIKELLVGKRYTLSPQEEPQAIGTE